MQIKNYSTLAAVILMEVALVSCGSDTPETPTTPPPAPVATVAPTPTPVLTAGCALNLPKGPGPGVDCPRTSPELTAVVNDAVNQTREENPGAYPLEDAGFRCSADQLDAFFKKVVDRINAGGRACAYRDGLELAVKSSNAKSEQWKFWVTSGHIRLGDNAYRATCTPAWF